MARDLSRSTPTPRLSGVVIFYPLQKPDQKPKPYPWAVVMRGQNPAVLDVELLNPYNGIDASQNERHLIRNVSGQPLRRGIYVDAIYDIGRIENAHFNPWWSSSIRAFRLAADKWRGVYFRAQRLAICAEHVLFRLQDRLQIHPHFKRASATGISSASARTIVSPRWKWRIRRISAF